MSEANTCIMISFDSKFSYDNARWGQLEKILLVLYWIKEQTFLFCFSISCELSQMVVCVLGLRLTHINLERKMTKLTMCIFSHYYGH